MFTRRNLGLWFLAGFALLLLVPFLPTSAAPRKRAAMTILQPAIGSGPSIGLTEFNARAEVLHVAQDGNLWFINPHPSQLGKINPQGALSYAATLDTPDFSTYVLADMLAGPDGNIWFSVPYGHYVARLTPQGQVTRFPIPEHPDHPSFHLQPERMTFDLDGNLWITTNSSSLYRFTLDGEFTLIRTNIGNLQAEWMFTRPDGSIWIGLMQREVFVRMTTPGIFEEVPLSSPIYKINDVTLGPDGNVWFTEGWGRLGRITPDGNITYFEMPGGAYPMPYTWTEYEFPLGEITVAADNTFWFLDNRNMMLWHSTLDGMMTGYTLPYIGMPQQGSLLTITAGQDGSIWLSAHDNAPTTTEPYKIAKITVNLPSATPTPAVTTPPSGATATAIPRPTTAAALPAKVGVQQATTPKETVARNGVFSVDLTITNTGQGTASDATVTLPFDPNAVKVLDVNFSRAGAWVSAVDASSVTFKTGALAPNRDRVSATIRFLVLPEAPIGALVVGPSTVEWSDRRNGGSARSNGVALRVGEQPQDSQWYPLLVERQAGAALSYRFMGATFTPGEEVSVWYNTPAGKAVAATAQAADANGVVQFEFSAAELGAGRHTMVVYGTSSEITAVGAFDGPTRQATRKRR